MAQCDKIFQEIKRLQESKAKLEAASSVLNKLSEVKKQKPDIFTARGVDGTQLRIDFDQWWDRVAGDPENAGKWAERAVGMRSKPDGAEGLFENVDQLVRNLGDQNAAELLTMLQKQTGDWEFYNEKDFNLITAKHDRKAFLQLVQKNLDDIGIRVKDGELDTVIAENVGPFLGILNNQAKLQIMADNMNVVLRKRIMEISDEIRRTGKAPSVQMKRDTIKTWSSAIFAHRSLRVAKRRWGQMGQNWQRVAKENPALQDSLYRATGREAVEEGKQVAEEVLTATTEDLTSEGSLITQIIDAANKGPDGLKELKELQTTIKLDGVDPKMPLEEGWQHNWQRSARAAWKDNIFFSFSSQFKNNFLSQKLVYLAEGYKTAAGAAWELMDVPFSRFTQRKLGLPPKMVQGDLFKPYGTQFHRNYFKANWDAARMALETHLRINEQMRLTYREIFDKYFFEGNTPFAGAVDNINNQRGMMTVEAQYRLAKHIINSPLDWKKWDLPMQARDKIYTGLKVFTNRQIEKATGVRLPVYSALQLFSAVDQRAGQRAYMVNRHFDLTLAAAKKRPDLDVTQWAEMADEQMTAQIYQEVPTKQNIQDYRKEFDVGREVSDDEISATIAMDRAGAPVQVLPEQVKAYKKSFAMRMQNPAPLGEPIEKLVRGVRNSAYGDVALPIWRSAASQTVWDVALGNPVFMGTKLANAVYHGVQGKLTTKMMVDAQSAALTFAGLWGLWYTLDSTGAIVGNGPPVGTPAYRSWRERLAAEGRVPNSIFGIPWNMGGLPVLNTLFLWSDFNKAWKDGSQNRFDEQYAAEAFLAVGTGQLMRMPGFKQFQMLLDVLDTGDVRQWERLVSFTGGAQFPITGTFSGVGRDIGAITGTSRSDLWHSKNPDSDGRYEMSQWDESLQDHPLTKMNNWLKDRTYNVAPTISYWLGQPKKEKTWLGQDITRPEFWSGKWLIGTPGMWNNPGEYLVERELDRLGMLMPPNEILNQQINDIPISTNLAKELNIAMGSVRADKDAAYSGDPDGKVSASDGSGIAQKLYKGFIGTEVDGTMGDPDDFDGWFFTERNEVDVLPLIDAAVADRTLREALNYVLKSPEWEDWESKKATTTNVELNERPPSQIKGLIGPWVLQEIKDFYKRKAIRLIGASTSPDALMYQKRHIDQKQRQGLEEAAQQAITAEDAIR